MQPKQIKVKDKENLVIKWDDDTESDINIRYLRDECPCANCKGETILLKTFLPPKLNFPNPDMYRIKDIQTVGGYAIQITWKDGHNTGIYTFEYLKQLDKDQSSGTSQQYDDLI